MDYICDESGKKKVVVISVEEFQENYIRRKYYYFSSKKGASAVGYWNEGYFSIKKGSTLVGDFSNIDSFKKSDKIQIDEFLDNKQIKKHTEKDFYIVLEDINCSSISSAASIVSGRNTGGRGDWKHLNPESELFDLLMQNLRLRF